MSTKLKASTLAELLQLSADDLRDLITVLRLELLRLTDQAEKASVPEEAAGRAP